jgi:hypothetical protein
MSADLSKFLNGAPAVKEQVPDLSAKANAPGQKKKLEMVSSVTATGSASVTLSGSGDIIASGSATGSSSVTLAGTGDVSSSAAATGSASVTITGTGVIISSGTATGDASVTIVGISSANSGGGGDSSAIYRPRYLPTWFVNLISPPEKKKEQEIAPPEPIIAFIECAGISSGSASCTITGTASAVSKGKGSASASAAIAGRGSMRCAPRTSPLISHRPMAQIEIYSETWADPTEEELTALLLVEL